MMELLCVGASSVGIYLLVFDRKTSAHRFKLSRVPFSVNKEAVIVPVVLLALGFLAGYLIFGSLVSAISTAVVATIIPINRQRSRTLANKELDAESWPRIIEEIRLLTGSVGMSVPQALFQAGKNAPTSMRAAFAEAEREWLLTTDFSRTIALLKSRLDDATADAVCETLVTAHQIGGSELSKRLEVLIDDRTADVQCRKDARSKQAGVRFARRFVLIVPFGMALCGLAIGTGKEAYKTPTGQLLVVAAFIVIAGCWIWAGKLMKLPIETRVFAK
jgi:tight adherence protein B